MAEWNLGIKIEGLGDADAAHDDKQWRFSRMYQNTDVGGGDLYIPVLTDFPSSFAAEVDFRGARSSLGGFAVELQAQGTGDDTATDVASRLYRSRYVPVGYLGAALTNNGTSITVHTAGGAAVTTLVSSGITGIALERECIVLVSHDGSGVYTCVRGQFGTVAVAHSIAQGDDTAIFNSEHWHIPADREVTLFRVRVDRDILSEQVITRGVVRGVSAPRPGVIRLDCAGPLELLQLRTLCGSLWSTSVAVEGPGLLRTGSAGRVWNSSDHIAPVHRNDADASNEHRMLLNIDGKHAVIQKWHQSSERLQAAITVVAVGHPARERSPSFAGSPDIYDVSQLGGKRAWEFFSLHPSAPDLDASGGKLGKATVNGTAVTSNVLVALLQCLLTTPDGSNHATYDLGDTTNPRLYENLGFGVKSSLVDIAGIETLALQIGDYARMPNLNFGTKGEGFDGLEFFQAALKVLGCVITSGEDGKIAVVRFTDIARLDVTTVPQGDVVGMPVQRKRVEDTFDSLKVEYAEIIGRGTLTDTFEDVINHRRLLSGRHRSSTLDARGVIDRDLMRGPIIARHVQRYHYPIPELRVEMLRSQDWWPGDVIKLTHDKVYAGDGTRDVTAATMLVTGRNEDIKRGVISYRLLDVGVAYNRVGLIAPAARVTAWDSGTKTATLDKDDYTAIIGPNDEITSDAGATTWPVNSEVMFLQPALQVRDAGPFTITAVTNGTVVLDATPTGIAVNDIMVPAQYDDVDATQKAKWIWIAGSDDAVGAAQDDPFEWTL
jgi:hypothetical protein